MLNYIIKQGEAKKLTLTVTDENGGTVDLTECNLFLAVKPRKGEGDYAFSKDHGDFDLSQATQGIVSVFLTDTDTLQTPGPYVGELQVTFPGAPPATMEKSADFALTIERAVIA